MQTSNIGMAGKMTSMSAPKGFGTTEMEVGRRRVVCSCLRTNYEKQEEAEERRLCRTHERFFWALLNSYLILNDGNDVSNSLKIQLFTCVRHSNIHLLSQI